MGRGMACSTYKWKVAIYDQETGEVKVGKFCSIPHMNKEWNMRLSTEQAHRIHSHYRTDESMKFGKNSFLARWGHIKIEKIAEPVERIIVAKIA